MTSTDEQTAAVAAAHDLIQSYLVAINNPLLTSFDSLPDNAHVVDLGSGTGEPALPLARRRPDLRITGIDITPTLLDTARAKASAEGITTVDFRTMSMEKMEFADGSVDGIVSRMGLLMAGLTPFGPTLAEAARVLRPGGLFSVATWTDVASNPYTGIALPVLRQVLPEGTVPDFEAHFAESAQEGALERHVGDAGFTQIEATWFTWQTECPDFETWWQFEAGAGRLKSFFGNLDDHQRTAARQAMADTISQYRTPSGSYLMPATCRIITAHAGPRA
ncbi:class I SAM-dependent methyltransferase [Streptomyces sp. NPDC017991]|uniref:class I SAM-dependent methyltransferase n=1 Tax=Streptomyces sp. NPDC017991 TaxID=3365026 RepID=UPI0037B8A1DD